MSEFMDTTDLERALLRLITKSKVYANLYAHRVRSEFFTTEQRKFIFGCVQRTQADTKSHLTSKLLEFEIRHRIDDKDQGIYEGEWNIIQGLTVSETPDSIIDKLVEAVTGRQLADNISDVIDLMDGGDIQRAVETLKQSAMQISLVKDDQPIRELTDYEHRKKIIMDKKKHPEKYTGLKTGIFPTFDKKTGGFFKGELTLIAGVTGLGKSTMVKALQWGLTQTNPGVNVLHIANEEYSIQVENKFDALITETPYFDFKLGQISDENLEAWEDKMKEMKAEAGVKYGRIFSKEVPAFTDVTLVEAAYRELEAQGIKIDIILIDHLPHIVPILKAYGENDERWKAAGDCKELARSLQVPVVIPTQAATEVEEKQNKGKRAGKLDVYGSKGQIHVCNNFLIITYRGRDNTQVDRLEYERDVYWLVDCKKNRDGAPFSFLAKHHVYYGKVEEVTEDGDGQTTGDDHKADDDQKAAAEEFLKDTEEEVTDDKADTTDNSEPEVHQSSPNEEPPELEPITDYPFSGYCPVPDCGAKVYTTPGGDCCENGHGGISPEDEPPQPEPVEPPSSATVRNTKKAKEVIEKRKPEPPKERYFKADEEKPVEPEPKKKMSVLEKVRARKKKNL
jgi:replicative DNA helicase